MRTLYKESSWDRNISPQCAEVSGDDSKFNSALPLDGFHLFTSFFFIYPGIRYRFHSCSLQIGSNQWIISSISSMHPQNGEWRQASCLYLPRSRIKISGRSRSISSQPPPGRPILTWCLCLNQSVQQEMNKRRRVWHSINTLALQSLSVSSHSPSTKIIQHPSLL